MFATAKPDEVFVFRHNFNDNKWENVANKKDGSATVTFRKRGSHFFMRIVADGGIRVGYDLSYTTLCHLCLLMCRRSISCLRQLM